MHSRFAEGVDEDALRGTRRQPRAALARALLASTAIAWFVSGVPSAAWAQKPPPPTPDPKQYGLELIKAPAAWAAGYTGAGVTVAISDTGIYTTHPALQPNIDFARSRNFQLPTPDAAYNPEDISDLDGHGTSVAGITAATANSNAPGVAYDAKLVVLRSLLGFPEFDEGGSAAALNYFAGLQNVMVYNASYGPKVEQRGLLIWPRSTIDEQEAAAALKVLQAGKIIVAANGNGRIENPVASLNPNGLALYPFIQPANAGAGVYQDGGSNLNFSRLLAQPGLIIAVTAVSSDKTVASYAQFCGVTASWCVAAPGGELTSNLIFTTTDPTMPRNDPTGELYGDFNGTSAAAPHVTGALAILQEAYPSYGAYDLARVLFATAENIGGQAAVNAIYGYGLIRLDRAIAGPTVLAPGATVDVGAQEMTYWSQPLTTGGSFAKTGAGYLIIAGKTTASGDATVSAGALGVDGTLTLQTQLTVAQGATLAGFGVIIGNVVVNGTLGAGQLPNYGDLIANNGGVLPAGIPLTGTSPGTLTFGGNVTLNATAATRVNIDGGLQIPGGPGTYDKLVAVGSGNAFAVGGTLMPVLRAIPGGNNNFTPSLGSGFAFLSAAEGATVTGQFASIAQPATGLAPNMRFDALYSPTSVALFATPGLYQTFAAAQSLNGNLQSLGHALDVLRPAAGPRLTGAQALLFGTLYPENAAGIDAALGSLSGQGQAAIPGAILNAFSGFSDVLADRQAMLLAGVPSVQAALMPSIAMAYAATGPVAEARAAEVPFPTAQTVARAEVGWAPQWSTWGQGYGRWSRVGSADGLPGYDSNSGGFVLGIDRVLSPNLLAGAAFGYTRTSTNGSETKGTTDTYAGGLYATWMPGAFVFDARLATGPAQTGTQRSLTFPTVMPLVGASVNGWGALAAGEAGYRFEVAGTTLKPYAGLTAQTFKQNAFAESALLGLGFPERTFNRLTSAVGLWTTTMFRSHGINFMPQAKIAWTRDLRDDALVTAAALLDQPFLINAAPPGRDAAVVEARLAAWQSDNVRLFGGYHGEFRNNATSHQVDGGLRVIW
jgi:subtilase-type serine protease